MNMSIAVKTSGSGFRPGYAWSFDPSNTLEENTARQIAKATMEILDSEVSFGIRKLENAPGYCLGLSGITTGIKDLNGAARKANIALIETSDEPLGLCHIAVSLMDYLPWWNNLADECIFDDPNHPKGYRVDFSLLRHRLIQNTANPVSLALRLKTQKQLYATKIDPRHPILFLARDTDTAADVLNQCQVHVHVPYSFDPKERQTTGRDPEPELGRNSFIDEGLRIFKSLFSLGK